MRRWAITALLPLSIGVAMPAWAGDVDDCNNSAALLKTAPVKAVAACSHLADQGVASAQYKLGEMYAKGDGIRGRHRSRGTVARPAQPRPFLRVSFSERSSRPAVGSGATVTLEEYHEDLPAAGNRGRACSAGPGRCTGQRAAAAAHL